MGAAAAGTEGAGAPSAAPESLETRLWEQAALGAGMFGASGVVAIYGVGCLLACAIIAISGVVAAWLAALDVTLNPASER